MIITDTIIRPDGTVETREIEVSDNYFSPPDPEPPDPAAVLQEQLTEQLSAQRDTDALVVDALFRVTLLELGL